MKKFLLILFSLFLIPVISMAYGEYYYDYSSKSYQCVKPSDQLEIINGVVYCGGVHFESGGGYSCADPNAEASAGSCYCKNGYSRDSSGKCVVDPNWTLGGATSSANQQNAAESACDQSGGTWLSSMTCKCPTGCHQSSDGWCVADGEEMLGVCMGDGDGTFDGRTGGPGTSSSSGSSGYSTTTGYTTTPGKTVSGTMPSITITPKEITLPTITGSMSISNPISAGSFNELLQRFLDWILNIALVVAPLIIVYAGFLHVTAMGDMAKVTKARNIILFASIGFMVALMAKSLIALFVNLIPK